MRRAATIIAVLYALNLRAQEVYSVNALAEYSSSVPKVGVSAIMEGRLASFRGMVLAGGDVYAQVKMGIKIGEMKGSRILVFPFYLNMRNLQYNTPVGLMWSKTSKKVTLELGADFWTEKTEGVRRNYCTGNVSISYNLLGNRHHQKQPYQ